MVKNYKKEKNNKKKSKPDPLKFVSENREVIEIKIQVYKDCLSEIDDLERRINILAITKKKPIPARLVNKYFSFFYQPIFDNEEVESYRIIEYALDTKSY